MPAIVCSRYIGDELDDTTVVESLNDVMTILEGDDILDIEYSDDGCVLITYGSIDCSGDEYILSKHTSTCVLTYADGSSMCDDFWKFIHKE